MQTLVNVRWFLLGAALVCGVVEALPWVHPASVQWALPIDWAALAAAALQGLGTFAMSRTPSGGWLSLSSGYLAAVLWVVVYFAGVAAVEAGPGGLVYGLLIMMPGTAIALLAQFAALIGFARRR